MDYPVYCGQERAGTVRLTEEPGRVRAELRCRRDLSGLFRSFLLGAAGELPLGVLAPEGESLTLRRVLSAREVAALGPIRRGEMRLSFSFRREAEWRRLEEGERPLPRESPAAALEGTRGALWRERRGHGQLAVPFDSRRPFPLPALFCFARVDRIGGELYAVFTFDAGGSPVMETDPL